MTCRLNRAPPDFRPALHIPGDTVVVAFASGASRFEWGNFLSRENIPHVLMRDTTDRWHQEGVKGIGDFEATRQYLVGLGLTYRRTVMLGLSSGSHAALLYGHVAFADRIVAISPTTGKGDAIKGDIPPEWWHRIEHGPEYYPVRDLQPLYADEGAPGRVRAFISDGEGTELDRIMIERIGVTASAITLVPGHSHAGLARAVRDNGMLEAALRGENR